MVSKTNSVRKNNSHSITVSDTMTNMLQR